jgi:glycerophosphoryl diester phosphodiesterase
MKTLRRILQFVLALLVLFAIGFGLAVLFSHRQPPHPWGSQTVHRPLVIAHQGGEGLFPSNTFYAFEQAVAMGVDVLEMDVHATQDGVLVLMHDATVNRTTDGTGALKKMTLAELQSLDAGYYWPYDSAAPDASYYTQDRRTGARPFRGKGITVPTLESVFSAFPHLLYNIEIKQTEPSIAEPLCALIRQHQLQSQVLVASFRDSAMQAFRTACPEVATSGTESEIRPFFLLNALFLGRVHSPQVQAYQVPEYGGGFHILTQRFVNGAHERGVQVHPWTINDSTSLQRMIDLGVDGIITDRPDLLLEILGR